MADKIRKIKSKAMIKKTYSERAIEIEDLAGILEGLGENLMAASHLLRERKNALLVDQDIYEQYQTIKNSISKKN